MRSRINLRLKKRIQELKQAGMTTSIATKVAKSEDKTDQKPKKRQLFNKLVIQAS